VWAEAERVGAKGVAAPVAHQHQCDRREEQRCGGHLQAIRGLRGDLVLLLPAVVHPDDHRGGDDHDDIQQHRRDVHCTLRRIPQA
jgi:hypothetical protein